MTSEGCVRVGGRSHRRNIVLPAEAGEGGKEVKRMRLDLGTVAGYEAKEYVLNRKLAVLKV